MKSKLKSFFFFRITLATRESCPVPSWTIPQSMRRECCPRGVQISWTSTTTSWWTSGTQGRHIWILFLICEAPGRGRPPHPLQGGCLSSDVVGVAHNGRLCGICLLLQGARTQVTLDARHSWCFYYVWLFISL